MSRSLAQAILCALDTDAQPTHDHHALAVHDALVPDPRVSSGTSSQQLQEWLRDAVTVVHSKPQTPSSTASAPLVVALALPPCSAEESACLLLVASQPRWVFVPVDARLPVARQHDLLVESNANRLITWDGSSIGAYVAAMKAITMATLPSLSFPSRPVVCYQLNEGTPAWLATVSPEQPLYVLFTSGSTGRPKGVVGTRRGAYERVMSMQRNYAMDVNSDCVVRTTRLTFVDAVAEILTAILSGVPLVHLHFSTVADIQSIVLHQPHVFADAVAQYGATRFTVVPSVLRLLLTAMEKDANLTQHLSSVRLMSVSGEALPLSLVERVLRLLPHVAVLNLYGSTEVSGDVTSKLIHAPMLRNQELITRWKTHGVPIGDWPSSAIGESTRLKLLKCEEDDSQELCVTGAAVAAGYLVNGELHEPPDKWIRDDNGTQWFRMGDSCRIVDSELLLCGRRDRQIKIRGNRVQLEDIERALKHAASLTTYLSAEDMEVVATTVNECDGGQEIIAFFITDAGPSEYVRPCEACKLVEIDVAIRRELFQRLEATFGALYVPHAVVTVANSDVPHLSSGKIDVKGLESLYERHQDHRRTNHKRKAVGNDYALEDPERFVLDLVQQSLNVDRDQITKEATWLELGGDSLKATLLSWELEHKLHKRISAAEILSMKIVNLINECISRKRQTLTSAVEHDDKTDHTQAKLIMKKPQTPEAEPSVESSGLPSLEVKAWYSRYNQGSQIPTIESTTAPTSRLTAPQIELSIVARVDLGKCIDASPLVIRATNGSLLVLIGSHSHKFVCLQVDSSASGLISSRVVWTQTLDDRIEATATISLDNGLVVIGTYSGALYAMDLASGGVRWKFQAQDMIKSSAVIIESLSLVVVGAYDRSLYGLNLKSGELLWRRDLPGSVYSTPVYNELTRQLIVATTTGAIMAWTLLTRSNLIQDWRVSLPAPVFASLMVTEKEEDRLVIAGCANGILYALDATSGVKRWEFATQKPIFSSPSMFSAAGGTNWITFGSHDGKLRKLSIGEGALQWEAAPLGSEPIFASPYVATLRSGEVSVSVVCSATTSGQLVFVEQASGELLQTQNARCEQLGEIFSSPVVVDDLCFVGTRSNELLVFKLSVKQALEHTSK